MPFDPLSLLLVSALALAPAHALRRAQTPSASSATSAKTEPLAYPSFEPFLASRMFKMMVGDPAKLDLRKTLADLKKISESMKAGKDAGESVSPKPSANAPNAALTPPVEIEQRSLYTLLPAVMMRLEPLWQASAWSDEQLALALDAAELLPQFPDGPKLSFAKDKPKENRAELEKLVAWFRAQVARPERYAAMIATMDDGPFVGLPYETAEILPAASTKKLGEKLELHLCKVERPKEPWVLQAVTDGKLLWSRVISGAPNESVRAVEFRPSEAMPLASYGWKAFLAVDWAYGKEACYLYLDPQGRLLFYFLSW